MKKLVNFDLSYTFQDYFGMAANYLTQDIIAEFGYQYELKLLDLPQTERELMYSAELKTRIERNRKSMGLNNETARREGLVAPLLLDAVYYAKALARIEFAIEVTPQLKGILDYFVESENNFLVVEAKNADLQRGFAQLAVELIALDIADETSQSLIYGAVTTGDEWRFGKLDRQLKIIVEDDNLYLVPQNLEQLSRILVGILEQKQ